MLPGGPFGESLIWFEFVSRREAHGRVQLRSGECQVILRAYDFLFSGRHPYLGAQVIGFHDHASFIAIFTLAQDRLGRSSGPARQAPIAFWPAGCRNKNPRRGKQSPVRCVRVGARMRP